MAGASPHTGPYEVLVTAAPEPTPQPWERLPGEPDRAFAAFRSFRDLAPSARKVEAVEAEVTPRQVRNWAAQWNWRDRAGAWDDELARVEDAERLEAIRAMHATHRRAGRAATVKAIQALSLLEPADIPAAAAVRLLEIGTRLERQTLVVSVAELQGIEVEDDGVEDPWERIARELDPAGA